VSTSTASNATLAAPTSVDGATEVYGSVQRVATPVPRAPSPMVEEKKPEPLEQDHPSIPIEPGTKCQRRGCHAQYVSDQVSRGDGCDAKCVLHPGYCPSKGALFSSSLVFPSSMKAVKVTHVVNGKSSNSTSTSAYLQHSNLMPQVPQNPRLHNLSPSLSIAPTRTSPIPTINRNSSMPRRLLPNPTNLRPCRLRQENR
jgi:hypothetical protein